MDSLTSLKVFSLVAELRSFTAAAERIGLSAAMTTKHVQHLERRLGARLFNRTSRSVTLTEAGTTYLARVGALLDGLEEAEAQLADSTAKPKGVLKVSLPVWLANPPFVRALAEYRERYPDVTLNLDLQGRIINLVDEGFDLALRGARSIDEGLIARKLTDIRFLLVGSPEMLAQRGMPQTPNDLEGAPFVAYGPIAGDGVIRYEGPSGPAEVHFRTVLLSENETLLHHAARVGMGLAVMPLQMVEDDLQNGSLVPVLADTIRLSAPLYAVYPNRSYLPAKVRTFLDFIGGHPALRGK